MLVPFRKKLPYVRRAFQGYDVAYFQTAQAGTQADPTLSLLGLVPNVVTILKGLIYGKPEKRHLKEAKQHLLKEIRQLEELQRSLETGRALTKCIMPQKKNEVNIS